MKKVLLVYATIEGQTEKISRSIAAHLEAQGCEVVVKNVASLVPEESPELENYDLLVFGASVHIGKIEKEMVAFINGHADQIKAQSRSLFIVLMAAATKEETSRNKALASIYDYLDKTLQVQFKDTEMFAGALLYTKYNWLVKWVMKRIARKEGGSTDMSTDHEYTDWVQVADYADRLADSGS